MENIFGAVFRIKIIYFIAKIERKYICVHKKLLDLQPIIQVNLKIKYIHGKLQ